MTSSSLCSPIRPWGIHPALAADLCPRCGWVARGPYEPALPDGDPPAEPISPDQLALGL